MFRRLYARWNRWRSSLWFLPAAMVLAAFAVAVGMIQVSGLVPRELLIRFPRLFGADAQSSRSMLSTIAGSMATIAGVTFSITVVAVAQASSQYTSRILRNFLSDRPSQIVLGMLTGTFVYCLVLIRTIRGDADLLFIPGLGVLTAFALAIISIAFLVYFIHHIAESLQASQILARVRAETVAAIDRLYPDEVADDTEAAEGAADDRAPWVWTKARKTGYLQQVDRDALVAWSVRRDALVKLAYRIGDYVVEGLPMIAVAPREAGVAEAASDETALPESALLDACEIGSFRTIDQDASFGVQQIVDIANKALSPGINDATTAINAIDTLGAILIRLGTRRIGSYRCAIDGIVRYSEPGRGYGDFVGLALHELRRSASGDVGVSGHLLHTIARVMRATRLPERRALLITNADMIRDAATREAAIAADAEAIDAARASVDVALRES